MAASSSTDYRIKYVGPAKQEFDSLQDQASNYLATYCPDWNNYDHPINYMIPPVFNFENPDVSDEAVNAMREQPKTRTKGPVPVLNNRSSDEAEYLVYNAIQQIQAEIKGPIIAVHNLDLKLNLNKTGNLDGPLTKIFPSYSWSEFQAKVRNAFDDEKQKRSGNLEFDFLLIGPEIGMVAIEVKSSSFDHERHFRKGSRHLPSEYAKGLGQLESIEALLHFLQHCAGTETPKSRYVRKILFTPNLEKKRYQDWKVTLSKDDVLKVEQKLLETVQWFKEDATNTAKVPLYSLIRSFLLDDIAPSESSHQIYEVHAGIIVALKAMVVRLEDQFYNVDFDALSVSKCLASLSQSSRIINQNPFEDHNKSLASGAQLLRASKCHMTKKAFHNLGVIFLSPDQQKAMNGGNRQVIIGVAGSGKTIILQAKAIELLERGESVLVLSPSTTVARWNKLLSKYDAENFFVYDWEFFFKRFLFLRQVESVIFDALTNPTFFWYLLDQCAGREPSRYVPGTQPPYSAGTTIDINGNKFSYDHLIIYFEELLQTYKELCVTKKHIFIDDAFRAETGHQHDILLTAHVIMLITEWTSQNNVAWMAFDPDQYIFGLDDPVIYRLSDREQEFFFVFFNGDAYGKRVSRTALKQVMRCSASVFDAAYPDKPVSIPVYPIDRPTMGHKVLGIETVFLKKSCSSPEIEDIKGVFDEVVTLLQLLVYQGDVNSSNLAVIVNTDTSIDFKSCTIKILKQIFPHLRVVRLVDVDSAIVQKNTIVVADCREVYSLEWPILIHICFCSSSITQELICKQYIARTRAICALVDLFVTVGNGTC